METIAVTIFASDRKALLRDVTTVIAEKNINIKYINLSIGINFPD